MSFNKINPLECGLNAFKSIGTDWFLVSAGDTEKYGTMTASWGQMGVMWGKNVFTCMIRPSRHTYNFVKDGEFFTASFFDEKYRGALSFCGSHSGRGYEDKGKAAGLTPVSIDSSITFEEAGLVFVCKKIYAADMSDSSVIDGSIRKCYGENEPYHTFFIGEIAAAYQR